MKTSKLLKKAEELFSAKKSKQRKKVASLKETLAALKKKKHHLNAKMKSVKSDHDRQNIRKELEVVRAQRHKGLKILKDLK
jgi:hypothetical protein